jgi:hypothetical protein
MSQAYDIKTKFTKHFQSAANLDRRTQKRITETADRLQTLTALGQAEELAGERFTAV